MNSSPEILMFHKPRGVVTTRQDELGRRTIYHILPEWVLQKEWVPVGRLDRDTRGLLLLVKNTSLVEHLAAPGRNRKVYEVWVRGRVTPLHIEKILKGIATPVGVLSCTEIEVQREIGPKTVLTVVLEEGKNRHIRRMFGALQDPVHGTPLKVLDLKRTQFGSISLDIPSGEWRLLTPDESRALCRL